MGMVAPLQRIASAFCVWFGRRGAVTAQAGARGVSRQTVYRESGQAVAAVAGEAHAAEVAGWRERAEALRQERDALRAAADRRGPLTVTIDAGKQAEFAATGQANGVSLSVLRALLAVLLGEAAPSVARLGRCSRAAGARAAAALAVLDAASRPLAKQVAADEIYSGRQPVLMAVEPESLCWLSGRAAPADETAWAAELRTLPDLEQVTADRGTGLHAGLSRVNAERRAAGRPAVADQLDHFHLLREGGKALCRQRRAAARALARAAAAEAEAAARRRRGVKVSGWASVAARRWRAAAAVFDRWSAAARAWQQLREGLHLFTPDGALNSRARVAALIAQVRPALGGPEWVKVRRWLGRRDVSTFLDRTRAALADVSVEAAGVDDRQAAAVRQTLVEAEGLRRRPALLAGDDPPAAARRGVVLLAGVLVSLLGAAGQRALDGVRAALRQAWRASSPVEGINSVLRMQQGRHRRLTQPLLDLKRLYWNCRRFRTGRRRGQSPYERLGLVLPRLTWWELLNLPPEQLRQVVSAPEVAA